MPRPCLTALAAIAAVSLFTAAPAVAHHQGTTSATASLALDPRPGCKMVERRARSRCDGTRVVRVSWTVACGARPFVTIHYWSPRPGGGAPIALDSMELLGERTSGVTARRFGAGVKVFATVAVDCYYEDLDGGSIPDHSDTATSAPTAEAYIPPRLDSVEIVSNAFCGLDVPVAWLDTVLQARQASNADVRMTFDDRSLLGVDRFSRAGRRRTMLFARGAGLRMKAPAERSVPGAGGPIKTEAGIRWSPRRAGTLRVWAEVGGHRTNVLAIRVVRARCR